MKSIVWFRHNLRLSDNPSLIDAACEGAVLPVTLWDPSADTLPDGARKWWRQESLRKLGAGLARLGATMAYFRGEPGEILPRLASRYSIDVVRVSPGRTVAERRTDERVGRALSEAGVRLVLYPDDYLLPPDCIAEGRQGPWKVFTPFWRRVRATLAPERPLPPPSRIDGVPKVTGECLDDWGWDPAEPDWARTMRTTWTPGEQSAQGRLAAFVGVGLAGYAVRRDLPGEEGSSRLSPHLSAGEITPRQIWWAVEESGAASQDQEKFLSELGWREFSAHLLHHHPGLPEVPLRPEFRDYPWSESGPGLSAWKKGMTGFPLVDAGMRELRLTGWMPNRVRMVAASLLVKNLGISWSAGLSWFADNLVDYDTASNAASWQWVAGCGADAASFFRVMNPVLQGERYDPRGDYVRRFIPELSRVPERFIHRPWFSRGPSGWGDTRDVSHYPPPVVDLKESREQALNSFFSLHRQ